VLRLCEIHVLKMDLQLSWTMLQRGARSESLLVLAVVTPLDGGSCSEQQRHSFPEHRMDRALLRNALVQQPQTHPKFNSHFSSATVGLLVLVLGEWPSMWMAMSWDQVAHAVNAASVPTFNFIPTLLVN